MSLISFLSSYLPCCFSPPPSPTQETQKLITPHKPTLTHVVAIKSHSSPTFSSTILSFARGEKLGVYSDTDLGDKVDLPLSHDINDYFYGFILPFGYTGKGVPVGIKCGYIRKEAVRVDLDWLRDRWCSDDAVKG